LGTKLRFRLENTLAAELRKQPKDPAKNQLMQLLQSATKPGAKRFKSA